MKFFTLALFTFLAYSCQKNPNAELQEAQACLNTAAPSTARSCVESLKANTTPESYKLQCAAIYISEGYGSIATLFTSLEKMNEPDNSCGGECSPTVLAMTEFKFTSNVVATEAFDTCKNSLSKGYTQISSLFKLGTMASEAYATLNSGVIPSTPAEVESAISSLPPADLGAIVLTTYEITCSNLTDASDSTAKYCSDLNESIGSYGEDAEKIGICLKKKLIDPDDVCAP
jgi:hypothetical protein